MIATRPRAPVPALYAGIMLTGACAAFYVHIIVPFLQFPADLFMWGETDFVGNIIRLRGGHPMYSPVEDINSSTYPPLVSVLTYGITRLLGLPVEVPVLRTVQWTYTIGAALVGVVCWGLLRPHVAAQPLPGPRAAWMVFTLLVLFLAATAPVTSTWVHALHTDAFSLLWSAVTFAALLWYFERPGLPRLCLLAVAPAIGFAAKQYLLIWAPIAFFTLLADDHRRIGRLVQLFALTTAATAMVVLTGYLLWGGNYLFWVFEVVGGARSRFGLGAGGFDLSIPRAADHLLRAWAPLSLGFVAGWWVLTRVRTRRAMALWTPWLLLITTEALTSGTGWDALYHFGPGVLIGAVWLLALLPEQWPEIAARHLPLVVRSGAAIAGILAMILALGAMPSGGRGQQRYWQRTVPEGTAAYVRAIEAEFEGHDPADVLLDWGNWVYLRSNHLALDRAISMWDFPTVGRYDLLEPLLARIRAQRYKKILLHRYHSPAFDYDWGSLERPTGVRAALATYYDEIRVLPGLPSSEGAPHVMFGGEVSVLVPRTAGVSTSDGEAPAAAVGPTEDAASMR